MKKTDIKKKFPPHNQGYSNNRFLKDNKGELWIWVHIGRKFFLVQLTNDIYAAQVLTGKKAYEKNQELKVTQERFSYELSDIKIKPDEVKFIARCFHQEGRHNGIGTYFCKIGSRICAVNKKGILLRRISMNENDADWKYGRDELIALGLTPPRLYLANISHVFLRASPPKRERGY